MKPGQKVQFVNPSEGENKFPMFIVWSDRERSMIRTDIGSGGLNPTMVVKTSDLCVC